MSKKTLWSPSTVSERKNAVGFKLSKKTLKELANQPFETKSPAEDLKKYSKKVSSRTWNKILNT